MAKICKNPKCQKEVLDTMNYCSEDCLRQHLEIKKENKSQTITIIKNTPEGISEIEEICNIFGFKHTDGLVSGSHNATILGYLRQQQEGVYSTVVDKLTWVCHMSGRCLKENYLKGIEAFGIIETFTNEFGVIKWRWIGLKALKNNGGEE